jgi:hypothetical protein
MRGRRLLFAPVCAAALVVAAGCHPIVAKVRDARTAAEVPALVEAIGLREAAAASAARMCTDGTATTTPDPLTLDDTGFARAIDELAGTAELDEGIEDPAARRTAAIDEVWSTWASDPTLIDPRWDAMGVADHTCADGSIYVSLVLRDSTPGLHPEGKTWLFVGQEMGATGGFPDDHDQGYVDYVGHPAGITTYADLRFASALHYRYNVGTGDICSQCYVDNPAFDGSMIALGLHLVGDLPNIVSGARDAQIDVLGDWIRGTDRMVFLRIGYEFDGSWNGYDPAQYKAAFRRIVTRLRANGVENFATVWQSSGTTRNPSTLLRWYPGDDVVDWLGYSYFNQTYNPSDGVREVAAGKRKPVMIAEATPKRNLSLGDPVVHWNAWFQTFFDRIEAEQDQIKAVAYINTRWFAQPGWTASWGDSRVQIRGEIKSRWLDEIGGDIWAAGDTVNAANTYVLTPEDLTPP